MYPVFLLAAPEIAESLIRYRTDRLSAAQTNARINGFAGAMFPWESGLSGAEVTPVYAATSEEHHITLDVAFACIQHAHASGTANSSGVRFGRSLIRYVAGSPPAWCVRVVDMRSITWWVWMRQRRM